MDMGNGSSNEYWLFLRCALIFYRIKNAYLFIFPVEINLKMNLIASLYDKCLSCSLTVRTFMNDQLLYFEPI